MRLRLSVALITATLAIVACDPANQNNTPPPTAQADIDLTNASQMVKQLPSPIEMAILVKHSGGSYDPALLSNIKNLERYATEGKKTLNMGVYSADVGYTSLYKQTQETMFYLNNVRKLSDAIGLSQAFDQALFDRVEANIQSRDSLLHILSGAYEVSNEFLKENNRINTSLLMLAGGWVETVYLASRLGPGGSATDEILKQIQAQKPVLDKLVEAMALIKDDASVAEMRTLLLPLKEMMDNPDLIQGEGENTTIDRAAFVPILAKIAEVRAWVIA